MIIQSVQHSIELIRDKFRLCVHTQVKDNSGKVKIETQNYYFTSYTRMAELDKLREIGRKIDLKV